MSEYKFKDSTTIILVILSAISIGILTAVIGLKFIDDSKLFEFSELIKVVALLIVELLFIFFIAGPMIRKLIFKNRNK